MDLAFQTFQPIIQQLTSERDDVRQRLIRAQIQIGGIQKENIYLKQQIHALHLEIEKLKVNLDFFKQINCLQ